MKITSRFAILWLALALVFVGGSIMSAGTITNTIWFGGNDGPPQGTSIEKGCDCQDIFGPFSGVDLTIHSIGNVVGSWQQFPGPSEGGDTFFANPSLDGPQMAVGYLITGTGGQTNNPASPHIPTSQLQYFGTASGGAANSYFTADGPVTWNVKATITSLSLSNVLDWYLMSDPNNLHPLCTSAGCVSTFDPGGAFGIAFGQLSSLAKDSVGPAYDMAFFQQVTPTTATPEGATGFLVGSPLILFGWIHRKRILGLHTA